MGMFILIGKLWTMTMATGISNEKNHQALHPIYLVFAIFYTILLSLIPQIDIMRLAMPLAPLLMMAFHDFFESKSFRIGLLLSVPMLYLYVLNFIMTNQAPISDWAFFR
jgi:hypothetical protein